MFSCFPIATLPELNKTNFAEIFTESLDSSNTFDAVSVSLLLCVASEFCVLVQEMASSFQESINKIDDGDAYFGVNIDTNFSDSLYFR